VETTPARVRLTCTVEGAVQLVGFRPYVHNLAIDCTVYGYVENTHRGATIVIEGTPRNVEQFVRLFPTRLPRLVEITNKLCWTPSTPTGIDMFTIRSSSQTGTKQAALIPDAAICPTCSASIRDTTSRYYRHAFASCVSCGPRVSIQTGIPGDRAHTTMAEFPLCARCDAEYTDHTSRYYHAQAFCCPECGPQLAVWDSTTHVHAVQEAALTLSIRALREGMIVAVKGTGGFHLMCDATNAEAVRLLRIRKQRTKPLAMMYPTMELINMHCNVSPIEQQTLTSKAAPIVILTRHRGVFERYPAEEVVGSNNPTFGIMLPYTPLHQLLLDGVGVPLVATSANMTDEPVLIDERDACQRLHGVADLFLVHNRRIVQHMDDSVVRIACGAPLFIRRARGYAPFPLTLPNDIEPVLAVGSHQKNTVALAIGHTAVVSQHGGDLSTRTAEAAFRNGIHTLCALYESNPSTVLCDFHPEYYSTRWAHASQKQVVPVQHHVAHVLAVAGECTVTTPYLGIAFDGTGLGLDYTIWGGECFSVTTDTMTRIGHMQQFRVPGGDYAARESYRSALGVLYALYGTTFVDSCSTIQSLMSAGEDTALYVDMLSSGQSAPRTSSVGRLFDAAASILGIRQISEYEGQAAMELEWYATRAVHHNTNHPTSLIEIVRQDSAPRVLSWKPLMELLVIGVQKKQSIERLAYLFHHALASAIVCMARDTGHDHVVLSGGCFQNKLLLELTVQLLRSCHITPHWPTILPPNDGALSFGQLHSFIRTKRTT
jgi:hydrogenase maturation protein HypF